MAPLMDYTETHLPTTHPDPPTTKHRRTFAIVPAKPHDARRLVDIEFHAFESNQLNQILSYRDHKKAAHFERSVRLYADAMAGDDPADVAFSKVVDALTGEIVSFAKVECKRYTPEELRAPLDAGHEGEARMNREWFALNERLRREFVGRQPHCYIGMLATAPAHQHHGAGTQLLAHILARADAAGLPVYLEATATAKRLYERHGFVPRTELRFDPAAYGVQGLGVERQTVMVRGALAPAAG